MQYRVTEITRYTESISVYVKVKISWYTTTSADNDDDQTHGWSEMITVDHWSTTNSPW